MSGLQTCLIRWLNSEFILSTSLMDSISDDCSRLSSSSSPSPLLLCPSIIPSRAAPYYADQVPGSTAAYANAQYQQPNQYQYAAYSNSGEDSDVPRENLSHSPPHVLFLPRFLL
ncbi:hypothetical protein NMY22_g8481 [Coprinellus aureogranulatus]|nr:hypothetical protein NMY22_g8481 [Coprinellus aureogranulatus]